MIMIIPVITFYKMKNNKKAKKKQNNKHKRNQDFCRSAKKCLNLTKQQQKAKKGTKKKTA